MPVEGITERRSVDTITNYWPVGVMYGVLVAFCVGVLLMNGCASVQDAMVPPFQGSVQVERRNGAVTSIVVDFPEDTTLVTRERSAVLVDHLRKMIADIECAQGQFQQKAKPGAGSKPDSGLVNPKAMGPTKSTPLKSEKDL